MLWRGRPRARARPARLYGIDVRDSATRVRRDAAVGVGPAGVALAAPRVAPAVAGAREGLALVLAGARGAPAVAAGVAGVALAAGVGAEAAARARARAEQPGAVGAGVAGVAHARPRVVARAAAAALAAGPPPDVKDTAAAEIFFWQLTGQEWDGTCSSYHKDGTQRWRRLGQ